MHLHIITNANGVANRQRKNKKDVIITLERRKTNGNVL